MRRDNSNDGVGWSGNSGSRVGVGVGVGEARRVGWIVDVGGDRGEVNAGVAKFNVSDSILDVVSDTGCGVAEGSGITSAVEATDNVEVGGGDFGGLIGGDAASDITGVGVG